MADLMEIDEQLNGSVDDRIAASGLSFVRLQLPLVDCMESAGLQYTPPSFFSGYDGWPASRAFSDNDVLASVDDETVQRDGFFQQTDTAAGLAEIAITADDANPGYTELPPEQQAAWIAQSDKCLPEQDSFTSRLEIESAASLKIEFDDMISAALKDAFVQQAMDDYPSCLETAGFIADSRAQLFDQVFTAFVNKDPTTFHPGTPTWEQAAELENAAAAADAKCRRAAYDAALTVLAEPVVSFKTTHAAELDAVVSDWADLVSEADASAPDLARLKKLAADARG